MLEEESSHHHRPHPPSQWSSQGGRTQSSVMPRKLETPTWTLAHRSLLGSHNLSEDLNLPEPKPLLDQSSRFGKPAPRWVPALLPFTRTSFRSQRKHEHRPWNPSTGLSSVTQIIEMIWIHSAFSDCGHSGGAPQHLTASHRMPRCIETGIASGNFSYF